MVHMHSLLIVIARTGFELFFGNPFDPQVLSNDHSSSLSDSDRSIVGVGTNVGWRDATI